MKLCEDEPYLRYLPLNPSQPQQGQWIPSLPPSAHPAFLQGVLNSSQLPHHTIIAGLRMRHSWPGTLLGPHLVALLSSVYARPSDNSSHRHHFSASMPEGLLSYFPVVALSSSPSRPFTLAAPTKWTHKPPLICRPILLLG